MGYRQLRHTSTGLERVPQEKDIDGIKMNTPAETTGSSGSLSLKDRKDIKKGIKWTALMAFKALLDVSLRILERGKIRLTLKSDSRETPKYSDNIIS